MNLRLSRAFTLLLIVGTASADPSPKDLLAAGRADETIQVLQQRIERSPGDAEAQNLLCRTYFMLEEWDRGIAACVRARDLDSQNSLYSLWLGRVYGEKADHVGFMTGASIVRKVRGSFERAVELDPRSWEARTDLAEFYLEAPSIVGGGKTKAAEQANEILPLKPPMAHWILGRIAEKDHDAATAEREYREEISTSHSGSRAWLDLAIFFRHDNRLDDMEQALHTMESAPVDRRESLMDGASLLLHTGRNVPMAIRLLRLYLASPVEEGPAFKAHEMLGRLLETQGDRKDAAEEFRAALALAHGYTRAEEDLKRVQR